MVTLNIQELQFRASRAFNDFYSDWLHPAQKLELGDNLRLELNLLYRKPEKRPSILDRIAVILWLGILSGGLFLAVCAAING